MHTFSGRCHCGAIAIELHSGHHAGALPVRTCSCTYCSRVAARYTSDPTGRARIVVADPGALLRYRFGLQLADFLSCARCGVYLGAYEAGSPSLAVININVLDNAASFTGTPCAMTFDGEDETVRRQRRAQSWTPAELISIPATVERR